MSRLVDFHSHFFSRPFFEALASESPLEGTPLERMDRVALEAGIRLPVPDIASHLGLWLSELDRYGVQHLVTFASHPAEADAVGEAVRMASGRLSALAVVNPRQDGSDARLATLLAGGDFRGALLFPAMHRYALDGPELEGILKVLEAHRGIALVHCGLLRVGLRDRFGFPRGYDLTLANPLALARPAECHPEVRFVIPHFGAGYFRETLMLGAQTENVFVDTSSSNSWIATQPAGLSLVDVFERALGVFGPRRILFGTDSSIFPRGWRHDVLLSQREALGACGLDDADIGRILGENAAALLGLGQVSP
ncbi:MAG TPA: hypothetical protein ENJ09_12310 [Planctomycetes bacterium]|nr:hypothetical protein [Planctomycetota bacterium]